MRELRRYSNPYTRIFSLKTFRWLRCKSLTKCNLASEWKTEKMRLLVRTVSVSVRSLYPARYRHGGSEVDEPCGAQELEPDLSYWWRCFIAEAQRRINRPIQSAAR